MSLLVDWKQGSLEEREYYIKTSLKEEPIRVDTYTVLGVKDNKPVMGFLRYDDVVVEVLGPCDYEELKRLKEENKHLLDMLGECSNQLKLFRELMLPIANKQTLNECDNILYCVDDVMKGKK